MYIYVRVYVCVSVTVCEYIVCVRLSTSICFVCMYASTFLCLHMYSRMYYHHYYAYACMYLHTILSYRIHILPSLCQRSLISRRFTLHIRLRDWTDALHRKSTRLLPRSLFPFLLYAISRSTLSDWSLLTRP